MPEKRVLLSAAPAIATVPLAPAAGVARSSRPAEIEVEFIGTAEVDKYRGRAGVEVTGPRWIVARRDTWWDAWRHLFLEPALA